jgi:hypothetical protein
LEKTATKSTVPNKISPELAVGKGILLSYNCAKLYMRVLNLFPFPQRVLILSIEKSTVLDLRTLRHVDLFTMFSAKKIFAPVKHVLGELGRGN